MNKNNSKIISNMIIKAIIVILCCIIITILTITAIPYAIIKGISNLDYYEEWGDFIFKYIPLKRNYY